MVEYIKQVAASHPVLTVEERNLLSVGYKNVVGSRRASWRIVTTIEHKEEARQSGDPQSQSSPFLEDIQSYKKKIEEELSDICQDALRLLDSTLIPPADSDETRVFYLKMYPTLFYFNHARKGDYLRYLAEFLAGDKRKKVSDQALEAYEQATVSAASLSPTLPIRLGLALNFSVFYYEIMAAANQACQLAKKAFDDALVEIDSLSEDSYKDSTLIMQLLRDNLSLWTSEVQEGEAAAAVEVAK